MTQEKVSILIVDDEEDLLEMYREIFEMDGFKVYTESSALAGMQVYKANPQIKMIISDSNMAGMSGVEFLKELKKQYKQIPFFYISTGAIEQSEEEIKAMGGTGLIFKPFDLDEIVSKVKKDLKL